MITYLKKYAKDPKKGIDRAWRSCQDKLLDLSRPITKILEMGFRAKESGAQIDPDDLIEWVQCVTWVTQIAPCQQNDGVLSY